MIFLFFLNNHRIKSRDRTKMFFNFSYIGNRILSESSKTTKWKTGPSKCFEELTENSDCTAIMMVLRQTWAVSLSNNDTEFRVYFIIEISF